MSNSYVQVLQGLFHSIFADCMDMYPNDRKGLERDESRLLSLLQTRGLGFATLDLPSAGKVFDSSLANGFLLDLSIPGMGKKVKEGVVPIFLSTLLLKVFEVNGMLCSDPDTSSIFLIRQLFYAAKKLKVECDENRTSDAVREFFRIEDSLRSPSLLWDDDFLDCGNCRQLSFDNLFDDYRQDFGGLHRRNQSGDLFGNEGKPDVTLRSVLETIQHVADIVSSSLGWFDPLEWDAKHGPGAVSDVRSGISKYTFPNWPEKLECMFPSADFAFANYSVWVQSLYEFVGAGAGLSSHEPPSKLIAVPKTQKGPRLIASEPAAHQFVQQTVNAFLRSRKDSTPIRDSICFNSQIPNQELALKASSSQSHATIDLSSASDRMSLWVIERAFRSNIRLLQALHSCRTRWLVNSIDKQLSNFCKLKKVAAQGAAFTFPLQTILYSIVSIGCMLHILGLKVTSTNIECMARETRIFGDDIIIPIDAMGLVASALQALGFEVNHSKSFGTGKFRESCGCDAYDGVDVTPAYYLRDYDMSRPASMTSIVESSNNFYMKGLFKTADWILSTLPDGIRKNLPLVPVESGAFGLKCFSGLDLRHLERRYNRKTQKHEVRCVRVITRQHRISSHWNSNLLQYFIEAPSPSLFVKWKSGVDSRPKVRVDLGWVPEEHLLQ